MRHRPDLLGATLHAAAALDQLAEIDRDRPVAGVCKPLAQLPGPAGTKTCIPSLTALSPKAYASASVAMRASGKLTQQPTALLTERVRIVGNVITLVVEHGQSKIEMEEPRVDQLKADHFAISQRGQLAMSLQVVRKP